MAPTEKQHQRLIEITNDKTMEKVLYDKVNKRIVKHWFVDNEGNFYRSIDPYGVQMSGKITIMSVTNNPNYEMIEPDKLPK
jgi:hypothetical protein